MTSFNQYKGATVLVTGHTGFKGTWLCLWLKHLGANVVGISNDVPSIPSHFSALELHNHVVDYRLDICDGESLKTVIHKIQPDFIFHLAAQAIVRTSYENPIETLKTNAFGSANLLDALRTLKKSVVAVMITSDKVYDNLEWAWGYRETDKLGGKDPYSASKGMAELVIRTFVESYFNNSSSNIRIGIARAGNVIGGGDWAKDRIVPDCVKAWSKGEVAEVRNPEATRPWQHVLEPLSGYLTLGVSLAENRTLNGEAYNFGPTTKNSFSVQLLIEEMEKYWDQVSWTNLSQSKNRFYEAGLLKLNCDKALHDLHWVPTLNFSETVRMTAQWYKTFYDADISSMYEFSMLQIVEYSKLAKQRQVDWAIV